MISNRCYYALKAVLELAKREGKGLSTISEIAAAQQIPPRFLEAILIQLKRNGIAESVRGKEGGYRLAKRAANITVGDVIRLYDSLLFEGRKATGQKKAAPDVFQDIWHDAQEALSNVIDRASFADLAERARKNEEGAAHNYVI